MRRGGLDVWAFSAAGMCLAAGVACRDPRIKQDEALYCAEAGIELGRRHIAATCSDFAKLHALREAAAKTRVPLPGFENPTGQAFGSTLPGRVSVRLGASPGESDSFLVVSTGEAGTVKRVLQRRVSCSEGTQPTGSASPVSTEEHPR